MLCHGEYEEIETKIQKLFAKINLEMNKFLNNLTDDNALCVISQTYDGVFTLTNDDMYLSIALKFINMAINIIQKYEQKQQKNIYFTFVIDVKYIF